MIADRDIEEFLSHVGVKGMKWGVRKPRDEVARAKQFGKKTFRKGEKGDFDSRSKGQQAALVGAGVASWVAGANALHRILGRKAPVGQLVANTIITTMGVRATRTVLDRNGQLTLDDIPFPEQDG